MLRITKNTDYGIVLLVQMAMEPAATIHNARDLAAATRLPLPMVSKILKTLARGGLLVSQRGTKGGYSLARPIERISISDVIRALEGKFGLTECATHGLTECQLEWYCQVRLNWLRINEIIQRTLDHVPLSDMVPARPLPAPPRIVSGDVAVKSPTAATVAAARP
jgi:FeS assembly SUF system regulator